MGQCVFCSIKPEHYVDASERLYVVRDLSPVTKDHMLVIPKTHKLDFFELDRDEAEELRIMLQRLRGQIQAADPSVTGFNIGMNCGKSAGQTVFHCHVHLIPRRDGDNDRPDGGVRGVLPEKQQY